MQEGEKKRTKLKDFKRYDDNPSSSRHRIIGLEITPMEQKIKTILKESGDSDEVLSEFYSKGHSIVVNDGKKYIKLYEEAQADLVKLNSSGIAVLTYVFINLRKLQDQMAIMPADFGAWYTKLEGCADSNTRMICYRGVIDLLKHEFIYLKTGSDMYFLNVNKFFNGKRTQIGWVNEISRKLANGVYVPKSAVKYDPNYGEKR